MKHRLLLASLALCLHATPSQATEMTPSNWEYTMNTAVPGVPFSLPAFTTTLCLSEKDTRYGVLTTGPGRKGDCRYENLRQTGNITRYDMVCAGSAPVSGKFEFESTATTVSGRGVIDTGKSQITQTWQGKRLGDCG